MISTSELLYIFEQFKDENIGSNLPRNRVVLDFRQNALDIASAGRWGDKGEVAAIFFSFSVHDTMLLDAQSEFPFLITCAQMADNGLRLGSADEYEALGKLQDDVAEGGMDIDAVRAWFNDRLYREERQ
ncbi:MAG TPA: hypothetical protein VHL34_07150 [Rhizomicrobium sp.]|jgi:hypothetical protein|nr:hypothetical protein [Rhizomicrobium sp.]